MGEYGVAEVGDHAVAWVPVSISLQHENAVNAEPKPWCPVKFPIGLLQSKRSVTCSLALEHRQEVLRVVK